MNSEDNTQTTIDRFVNEFGVEREAIELALAWHPGASDEDLLNWITDEYTKQKEAQAAMERKIKEDAARKEESIQMVPSNNALANEPPAMTEEEIKKKLKDILLQARQIRKSQIETEKKLRKEYLAKYHPDEATAKKMIWEQIRTKEAENRKPEQRQARNYATMHVQRPQMMPQVRQPAPDSFVMSEQKKIFHSSGNTPGNEPEWREQKLQLTEEQQFEFEELLGELEVLKVFAISNPGKAKDLLTTLHTLISKICDNFDEEKYRKISKQNEHLKEKVFSYQKAKELLEWIGYTETETAFVMEQGGKQKQQLEKIRHIIVVHRNNIR